MRKLCSNPKAFCLIFLLGLLAACSGVPEGDLAQSAGQEAPRSLEALGSEPTAIIGNGVIQLGVWAEGHLNVPGGEPSSGTGTSYVGLRYLPTGAEGTAPGCLCEGWGAGDALTGEVGYASEDSGISNVTPVDMKVTPSTAVSVTQIGSVLRVTHDYHPSKTPNLYEVTVTLANISSETINPRYRRAMDWDVEPTAFNEVVTIKGKPSNLLFSSDDGFAVPDPLAGESSILFTGEAKDSGPADHGALFDFGFDPLAAGKSLSFNIYYGAAGSEAAADAALGTIGAELYSYGQPNTEDGPTLGTPNTFIFAFAEVGGPPIFNAPPKAADQSVTTKQNEPVAVTLSATDENGDPLIYTVLTQPAHGTLTGTAPNLTYTPTAGYTGSDSFTFKANDGKDDSNTATVSLTVTRTDPPVGKSYTIDFTGLKVGQIVWDVKRARGLTGATGSERVNIYAKRFDSRRRLVGGNRAMIFDAECKGSAKTCSGGDDDLFNPGQGNVMIISQDGKSSNPNDNHWGGQMDFKFGTYFPKGVTLKSIRVMDVDHGATLFLYKGSKFLKRINVPRVGVGGAVTVSINVSEVTFMRIGTYNSIAVDDIVFEVSN